MTPDQPPLAEYRGLARLFPLPNLVFFPQAVQPLHIFEPRYRQMTADALSDDQFIALVLPHSGWEKSYAGKPTLHQVACLGQITAHQKLPDGRYNLLLKGITRVRIQEEVGTDKLYRTAKAEPLHEVPLADETKDRTWRRRLIREVPTWFPGQDQVIEEFRKLFRSNLSLGTLCDIMAFALPLDAEFKQTLLEERQVDRRLCRLVKKLESMHCPQSQRTFPPGFSCN
ncbi:MAG: LON peptidase substrate-binding domain-containing protein [Gemmataceae bacterium]